MTLMTPEILKFVDLPKRQKTKYINNKALPFHKTKKTY